MDQYKYVHFLWHQDTKFYKRVPLLFSRYPEMFDLSEHLFISPYQVVIDALPEPVHKEVMRKAFDRATLVKYAEKGYGLIFHSLPSMQYVLKIPRKIRRRIVWRTWGHDTGYSKPKGKVIENAVKNFIEPMIFRRMRDFRAVGYANLVDIIDLEKKLGQMNYIRFPYPTEDQNQKRIILEKKGRTPQSENYTVMIGHSGYGNDRHIDMLKKMERFRDRSIQLIIILSYGQAEYIQKVKEYIRQFWPEKARVITDFLPYDEYVDLCAQADSLILDGKLSYALGALTVFTNLNKKIYLNRDGLLREAFQKNGMPFQCTDEIDGQSFEEFCRPLDYSAVEHQLFPLWEGREQAEQWRRILRIFDEEENRALPLS